MSFISETQPSVIGANYDYSSYNNYQYRELISFYYGKKRIRILQVCR